MLGMKISQNPAKTWRIMEHNVCATPYYGQIMLGGAIWIFFVLIVEGIGLGDVFHVSRGQYILFSERFCMVLSLELYSSREFVQILSNDTFFVKTY